MNPEQVQVSFIIKNSQIHQLILVGHAGNGRKGENIVCAGISTLVQTIIIGIRKLIDLNVDITKDDGFLRCIFPEQIPKEKNGELNLLLSTCLLGLYDLEHNNPNSIKITFSEGYDASVFQR